MDLKKSEVISVKLHKPIQIKGASSVHETLQERFIRGLKMSMISAGVLCEVGKTATVVPFQNIIQIDLQEKTEEK